MRINTQDLTLQRNYLQKYQFLIAEYELVKKKLHPKFRYAKDFYHYNDTCPQSFLKYYNRFKQAGDLVGLLPAKRGPKYKTRRFLPFIEEQVRKLRELGNNRYEIVDILKPSFKSHTPSPSGVYNILKRLELNRLTKPMEKEKRKIIKTRAGQLGHIDCHHLAKSVLANQSIKLYLVCVLDDYSRLAWAELVEDITALTVMFATLKCFNYLYSQYQIKFEEVLTDNGPEFGSRYTQNKSTNPFERMLVEMAIKHRYTRPYRPQTNGKVERFWKTLEDDVLAETSFETKDNLKQEILDYLVYYNEHRPHQSLDNKPNTNLSTKCLTSTAMTDIFGLLQSGNFLVNWLHLISF